MSPLHATQWVRSNNRAIEAQCIDCAPLPLWLERGKHHCPSFAAGNKASATESFTHDGAVASIPAICRTFAASL